MSNLTTKTLGIGGGLITVAGGAYGAYFFTNKQTKIEKQAITDNTWVKIEGTAANRLDKEGYRVLGKDEDINGKWKAKWDEFVRRYDNEEASHWGLTNWDTLKSNDQAPEAFRDRCIFNSQEIINKVNEKLYERVKEFCAVLK